MTLTTANIRTSGRRNRFRLSAVAVLFASLVVGSLVATPAANAAVTASTITTPTDPTFFNADENWGAPPATFAISGTTSGGDPTTDRIDIKCYTLSDSPYGFTVANDVPLNADGSFSVPDAFLFSVRLPCRLRAVPHGTNPADLTPFAGPRIAVGYHWADKVSGGPNDGLQYDYQLNAQQLTSGVNYYSLGNCGLYDMTLLDPSNPSYMTETFDCNASLHSGEAYTGTRSELQIDGANAYPPTWAEQINANASGLPAVGFSYSLDPSTGNLVIHESDPLVKCTDTTYPPTSTSCASFVSTGVTDNITITQDHDGHLAWFSEAFTSTDGQPHSLDLLWDNTQTFEGTVEYEFPGQSGYSEHAVGDTVTLPASPGTILVRVHGATDGDTSGQGAIVYDRPATDATFTSASGYSEFILHQTGTVPAGGSTRFRFAYAQDFSAANVASMAQTASTTYANTLLNTLSVSKSGSGSGTVASSPAGISCGATCSHGYAYGTPVTLTATPATGSTFSGWSGACSGTGTCTVTTNDATSVTATFSLVPETLTVSKSGTGSGTVTSSTAGISCGSTCSHSYPYGTSVTLTAAPATGSSFTGWSGACSGTGTCTVTTKAATSVSASFSLIPETLTVASKGDGNGTVTSVPAGISCGASCSYAYRYGSTVTLQAQPKKGSAFTGWSGACTGKATCTLSMSAARSVQAAFLKNCVVPKVKGKSLKKAKRTLKAHDCTLGRTKRAFSSKVKKGHVISQKPKPHKQLKRGAKIRLVVSKGKKH